MSPPISLGDLLTQFIIVGEIDVIEIQTVQESLLLNLARESLNLLLEVPGIDSLRVDQRPQRRLVLHSSPPLFRRLIRALSRLASAPAPFICVFILWLQRRTLRPPPAPVPFSPATTPGCPPCLRARIPISSPALAPVSPCSRGARVRRRRFGNCLPETQLLDLRQ